jgi:hypothetical protein
VASVATGLGPSGRRNRRLRGRRDTAPQVGAA